MNDDDETSNVFNFESALNKFGTFIMFGTLIVFFKYKINLLKRSKLKQDIFRKKSENNVDVDSRLFTKLSCLTNIGDGLEDLPKKPFGKFIKKLRRKIYTFLKFFVKPLFDIVEIIKILYCFLSTKKDIPLDCLENDINFEESFTVKGETRKVKSCVNIKYKDNEEKKEEPVINIEENGAIYDKYILSLMKLKFNEDSQSSSLLTDNVSSNLNLLKIPRGENSSNNLELASQTKTCNLRATNLKYKHLIKNELFSNTTNKTKSSKTDKNLKTEDGKSFPKHQNEILDQPYYTSQRRKLENKRLISITDSLIQNVAMNVCSNESNMINVSNFKSNLNNGKQKL